MAASPVYVGTPLTWLAALATANTNRNGTGAMSTLITAGSNGTRIDSIRFIAAGTTVASQVRLFLSNGSVTQLFDEIDVLAVTPSPSGGVPVWKQDITYADGFVLPAGWTLQASTNDAQSINVYARGGNL